jgi:hypothetical protein
VARLLVLLRLRLRLLAPVLVPVRLPPRLRLPALPRRVRSKQFRLVRPLVLLPREAPSKAFQRQLEINKPGSAKCGARLAS